MQRRFSFLFALFIAAVLITTGCRKDSDNPAGPGSDQPTVTTTIAGIVSDESGKGLGGIVVSAHGKTATTNQHGLFLIKDARVPQNRCFVLATGNGYFTGSRAETPRSGGVTHMRLGLMRNTAAYSVSASAGGTVTLNEGGSVQLPANGYVTGSGTAYTGTVKVAARWLNPTSTNFFSFFPGDFAATRTDGSQTELHSYGVLNVELMSASGEKLQLAPGKKATLKYPIPNEMLAGAPSEMPLWYFDETIGMWKEEGKAVRQGSFYVGEVAHFTNWNCDIPTEIGYVEGRVMCNNEPVPGVVVQLGEREVITDENGYYHRRVPRDITFTISVDPAKNSGITAAPISAGPVSAGQTVVVDIPVSPCPSYLTGTLVDCNGQPAEGVVQVVGSVGYGYVVAQNGQFRVRVESNTALTVESLGYNGGTGESQTVAPINSGETHEMGNVELCPQNAITYIDFSISSYGHLLAMSPDGDKLAVGSYNNVRIYEVPSGTLLQTLSIGSSGVNSLVFSNDGGKLLAGNDSVYGSSVSTYVWNTSTWQEIQSFSGLISPVLLPDGQSVLGIESDTREVVQYNIATGAEMARFQVTMNIQRLIGVKSNGSQFIYYGYDNNQNQEAVVWDMAGNTAVLTFPFGPGIYPYYTDLSADGTRMMAYSWGKAGLYNTVTGDMLTTVETGERGGFLRLAPDGQQFAAVLSDKQIMLPPGLYNASNGGLSRLLPSPGAQVYFNGFAFSGNGTSLAGLYNETIVRVWQLP